MKDIRVVVVTGEMAHHKHLCAQLSKNHNVAGILHPQVSHKSLWSRFIRRCRSHGIVHTILNASTRLPVAVSGWDARVEERRVESAFCSDYIRDYEALDRSSICHRADVRSTAGLKLLHTLRADVVVCLGGPIYPKDFIESTPLMLNFHSGLSPLYNGSSSANFAFANGHPNLCGGTLMRMSTVVDGGEILGHYLPEIVEGDTPETLFMKTVKGAALMYGQILAHIEQNGTSFPSIPQPRPLFYYQGIDWTLYHSHRVRRNLLTNLPSRFARQPRCIEYWRESDRAGAKRLYETTISELLWGTW